MKFYRYTFFKPPFDATKLSCIDIVSLVFFFFDISLRGILCGGGQGERETGRKGGGRCTEGGRRGGEKREKKGKITLHCTILRNLKKCKEAGANKYRAGAGIKGYGKRVVYTPFPSPLLWLCKHHPW